MSGKSRVNYRPEPSGNPVRDSALGLEPATLEPFLALNNAVWQAGPLPPADLELARLRNAHHVGCVFCKNVRYDLARADGLTEAEAQAAGSQRLETSLSGRQQLLLDYCDQYLRDPAGLAADLKAKLLATFSVEELLHLSLALAHFNAFSRCAVALGGMPDDMPVTEISLPA